MSRLNSEFPEINKALENIDDDEFVEKVLNLSDELSRDLDSYLSEVDNAYEDYKAFRDKDSHKDNLHRLKRNVAIDALNILDAFETKEIYLIFSSPSLRMAGIIP